MSQLTLSELYTALSTLSVPVFYKRLKLQTEDNTTRKYIVYHEISTPNVLDGSNKTLFKTKNIQLNLFTDQKDETLEGQVEAILEANDIQYEVSSEVYDEDNRLINRIYEFELFVFKN